MKTLLATLVLSSLLVLPGQSAEKQMWAKSVLGEKGPKLLVEQWLTPKPNTAGKFVLIDFWATWCPPCRKAIPELNGYQKKYADRLVVIGISDETASDVRKLKSPKLEYASAIDTKARTKNELKVTGIPHVIIMDPQGIVRWEGFPFLGGHELTDAVLEDLFNKYGDSTAKPAASATP
jgi:thiol-disulfide isomerase/thioredoxin